MTIEGEKAAPQFTLADSKILFGPPPVLSSENIEYYDAMWNQLTAYITPIDIVELMLVRNLVDATWELQRYVRHRTLSVERRFRKSREFQQKRAENIKNRREEEIRRLAQKMGVPADDFLRMCQLDSEMDQIAVDIDEIFERIPTELEHASALESAIEYHEQLERLINGAQRRRDNALRLLDLFRSGLGQRLREASDRIIGDANKVSEESIPQIEAPSIVPDAEGSS
jgi:hypothetical protein